MHSSTLFVSLLLIAAPFTVLSWSPETYDMYILKDPHILSINNGEETCDYWSNTWFKAFSAPFIKVGVIFTQSSYSPGSLVPTFLTSITIRFAHPYSNQIVQYTVTNAANELDHHFSNGEEFVNDDNGNQWLTIHTLSSGSTDSAIYIKDLNTLTSITIEQNGGSFSYYNLYITTDGATIQYATGLLISGCPSGYLDPPSSGRRRRSIPECQKLPTSSYEALNPKALLKICENDIKYIPNIVEELANSVKIFDEHKKNHESVLEYIKEKKEAQIKG